MTSRDNALRVAIGPFAEQGLDDWPLVGRETLAPTVQVLRFAPGQLPPEADALVVWSPEYHQVPGLAKYPGYRVACYGDWHIVPFESTRLSLFDLIATDLRGVRRLRQLGYPESARSRPQVLWFRAFSFDPRLHTLPAPDQGRDLDVAFCGRPDGGARDAWLRDVAALCDRRGWRCHLQTDPYPRGHEAAIYQRARVVVNRSARGELNMRSYEAAACGALVLVEQDNAEVYATGAPIPIYQDTSLEQTLAAWLADELARSAAARRQYDWVQQERPVDHLGWLCRQIRARLILHQERQPRLWIPQREQDTTVTPAAVGPQSSVFKNSVAAVTAQRDHPLRDVTAEVAAAGALEAPTVDEQRREVVTLLLEHQPAARTVLDVGCGTGGLGWWLRQQRPTIAVTGLDSDPAAVAAAAARLRHAYAVDLDAAPPWVRFAGSWARPGTYDAIICADVLEHLVFPQRCLARLRPLLAPDGVLVASIPNLRNLGVCYDLITHGRFPYHKPGCTAFAGPPSNIRCFGHLRFFCWADLEPLFAQAGYTLVREATQCTLMAAPGLDRFGEDLAHLVQLHGGDPDQWRREAPVMQFLVVARPNWQGVAVEG